jgi:hypothetical protein
MSRGAGFRQCTMGYLIPGERCTYDARHLPGERCTYDARHLGFERSCSYLTVRTRIR